MSALCNYRPGRKPEDNLLDEVYENSANIEDSTQLMLPPFANPATNLSKLLVDDAGKEINMRFDHGTTTLGFKYQVSAQNSLNNEVLFSVTLYTRAAFCWPWILELREECTSGLAASRRSSRSTSFCSAPWPGSLILSKVPLFHD